MPGALPHGSSVLASAESPPLGRPPPPPTAESTATAAAAARLVHLGGRVAQRRADLVDLELDDGALLALTRLVGTLLEPALGRSPANHG